MKCEKCNINEIHATKLCRSCYDKKNRNRINEVNKRWRNNNPKKMKQLWSKTMFDGQKEEVLERDNWKCQECGMSQEQSIVIFNRQLSIHHIDGNGAYTPKERKNNNINNLITMCMRCHKILHMKLSMGDKWGNLIKQDDSDWKYPKIRYLVEAEIEKGFGVQAAKRIVSKETGMSFTLIDHRYYDKKVPIDKLRSKTK